MWGFRLHWEKAPIETDTFSVWEPKCLYIKSVEESSSSNPSSKYLMVLFCCDDDGCHPGVKIWTHPTPTLFTWFGIFRLLTQPQDKKKKKEFNGRHFHSDDDIAVEPFLEVQHINFNQERIHLHHNCWTKCVNVEGDYVENKCARFSDIDSFYLRPLTYQSAHVQLTYRLSKLWIPFAFFAWFTMVNNVVTWQQSNTEWTNITSTKCRHPAAMNP